MLYKEVAAYDIWNTLLIAYNQLEPQKENPNLVLTNLYAVCISSQVGVR